eukprot:scaffold395_cov243-Pinguiococcus_pyrenoidosus.AAC.22
MAHDLPSWQTREAGRHRCSSAAGQSWERRPGSGGGPPPAPGRPGSGGGPPPAPGRPGRGGGPPPDPGKPGSGGGPPAPARPGSGGGLAPPPPRPGRGGGLPAAPGRPGGMAGPPLGGPAAPAAAPPPTRMRSSSLRVELIADAFGILCPSSDDLLLQFLVPLRWFLLFLAFRAGGIGRAAFLLLVGQPGHRLEHLRPHLAAHIGVRRQQDQLLDDRQNHVLVPSVLGLGGDDLHKGRQRRAVGVKRVHDGDLPVRDHDAGEDLHLLRQLVHELPLLVLGLQSGLQPGAQHRGLLRARDCVLTTDPQRGDPGDSRVLRLDAHGDEAAAGQGDLEAVLRRSAHVVIVAVVAHLDDVVQGDVILHVLVGVPLPLERQVVREEPLALGVLATEGLDDAVDRVRLLGHEHIACHEPLRGIDLRLPILGESRPLRGLVVGVVRPVLLAVAILDGLRDADLAALFLGELRLEVELGHGLVADVQRAEGQEALPEGDAVLDLDALVDQGVHELHDLHLAGELLVLQRAHERLVGPLASQSPEGRQRGQHRLLPSFGCVARHRQDVDGRLRQALPLEVQAEGDRLDGLLGLHHGVHALQVVHDRAEALEALEHDHDGEVGPRQMAPGVGGDLDQNLDPARLPEPAQPLAVGRAEMRSQASELFEVLLRRGLNVEQHLPIRLPKLGRL